MRGSVEPGPMGHSALGLASTLENAESATRGRGARKSVDCGPPTLCRRECPGATDMFDVAIIGDGPGGLSAALFLAKNGLSTVVYGQDKTAMHWAQLRNYLGINDMHGSEFQKNARLQVGRFGALLEDRLVEAVVREGNGFVI